MPFHNRMIAQLAMSLDHCPHYQLLYLSIYGTVSNDYIPRLSAVSRIASHRGCRYQEGQNGASEDHILCIDSLDDRKLAQAIRKISRERRYAI